MLVDYLYILFNQRFSQGQIMIDSYIHALKNKKVQKREVSGMNLMAIFPMPKTRAQYIQ